MDDAWFLPVVLGKKKAIPYIDKVNALYAGNTLFYYPLNDLSGTQATDVSGNNRHGTYHNVSLAQEGIGDKNTAAVFDGTSSYISLPTSWIEGNNAFPFAAGTLMCWANISSLVWQDGSYRWIYYFNDAGGTTFEIAKWDAIYSMQFKAKNGAPAGIKFDYGWFHLALTWSVSGTFTKKYINGKLIDTKGSPGSASGYVWLHNIGRQNTGYYHKGGLAHCLLLNRAATDAEVLETANNKTVSKRITVIGHSIPYGAGASYSYPTVLSNVYNRGNVVLTNRAVSGHRVMVDLDGDCDAAASDNADVILLDMGLNDDDNGNMSSFQAKIEANIVKLKASNPRAKLIYLNVLPAWTNNTNGPETVMTHIRPAISAACAAQGIQCVDTYTDPWILQSDTSDGWHPLNSGVAKIATHLKDIL